MSFSKMAINSAALSNVSVFASSPVNSPDIEEVDEIGILVTFSLSPCMLSHALDCLSSISIARSSDNPSSEKSSESTALFSFSDENIGVDDCGTDVDIRWLCISADPEYRLRWCRSSLGMITGSDFADESLEDARVRL